MSLWSECFLPPMFLLPPASSTNIHFIFFSFKETEPSIEMIRISKKKKPTPSLLFDYLSCGGGALGAGLLPMFNSTLPPVGMYVTLRDFAKVSAISFAA